MRVRINKHNVEEIQPGPRDVYGWDDKTRGFGIKVTPKGVRIYVLKCRAGRTQRWIVLGRHGPITADEARRKAKDLLGEIAKGKDPANSRDSRETVDELADRYLEEWAGPHKKPRSAEEDRRNLALHFRRPLGAVKASAVTRQDILKLHHAMRATPTAANRVLALLSKMFQLAEEWGIRPENSNPCRRIKKFAERKHDRSLSAKELGRLGATLDEAEREGEHPHGINAIRLLVLTGCRREEIMTLQWPFVDFEHGCFRLPDSKTGAKIVRLGTAALDLLAALPRFNSPFVFPVARVTKASPKRRVGAGNFIGIEPIWRRVRKRAGLEDVRLHDLRHSFGSVAADAGLGLPIIGAMLGHRQASTTARYVHIGHDPVQAAADQTAGAIAKALSAPAVAKTRQVR
jgi:integrase